MLFETIVSFIFLSLSIFIYAWGVRYHITHIRESIKRIGDAGDARFLVSVNTIGSTMLGGFKTKGKRELVYYKVFTFLYLFMFPGKCYLVSNIDCKGLTTTSYRVLCEINGDKREILSIFAVRWGLILSLLSVLIFVLLLLSLLQVI